MVRTGKVCKNLKNKLLTPFCFMQFACQMRARGRQSLAGAGKKNFFDSVPLSKKGPAPTERVPFEPFSHQI
mgnify:CR=1 FL=1